MKIPAVISEAILDGRLARAELRLLCVLYERASKNGVCRPSKVRLSKASGVNEDALRRSVRKLIDAGYLTCSHSKGRHTNVYMLNLKAVHQPEQDCSGSTGQNCSGSQTSNPSNFAVVNPNRIATQSLKTEQKPCTKARDVA